MAHIEESDLAHVWQHLQTSFHELNSARIFITGGTGFFGCWLLESLRFAKLHLGLQTEVVVLTRAPDVFMKKMPHLTSTPGLSFLVGDVRQFVYPVGDFTHVIHAATDTCASLYQSQPLAMLDTIVEGTRHVLDFAIAAHVKKFLLVSSGAVYGIQPSTLTHVDETYLGAADALIESSSYGLGKRMGEHLGVLYARKYGLEVKIARCFAFVGPYLPLTAHFAMGNFIHNIINKTDIRILGDAAPYRSYLYAADLVIWLLTILCQGQMGQAYNVGSEEAIDLAQLAQLVVHVSQSNLAVHIAKSIDPSNPPPRYVPNTHRAQLELGLKAYVSLEDSIQRTIRWGMTL